MALKVMSLELLNEITNNFSMVREIGRGASGVVYKATEKIEPLCKDWKAPKCIMEKGVGIPALVHTFHQLSGHYGVLDGELIAVKLLRPIQGHDNDDDDYHDDFVKELENVWRLSRHQNIIQLLGYCYETKSKYVGVPNGSYALADEIHRALCYEYMHNGSLKNHLYDEHTGHDWQTRYKIIKGICEGLKYLHEGLEKPMLHLDLKPENILLDTNMVPKIADFGLSIADNGQTLHPDKVIGGTRGYMPPEYIDHNIISNKSDIFSLGVVMIRIITGYEGYKRIFEMSPQETIDHVYGNWRKRLLQEMSGSSTLQAQCHQVKRCIEIALDCVRPDRKQRPTIGEVIRRLEELEAMMDMSVAASQWQQLILDGSGETSKEESVEFSSHPVADKLPNSSFSGTGPLGVVIVFAFDCSTWTSAWYTVYNGVFGLVEEKLISHFADSSMGYIYPVLTYNTYTSSDMKKLVPTTKRRTTYDFLFEDPRKPYSKNMASGLAEAQEMINDHGGNQNGIILFFSDGLIHMEDFFDGAENFISKVPVHTFTLGGEAYSQGLQAIAENSSGGKFHTIPVPEWPNLSVPFSRLLDDILGGSALEDEKPPTNDTAAREPPPLAVVIVYAFDCSTWDSHWYTVYDGVYWMVHEKLTHFDDCMGYIYPMLNQNTYTSDLKLVDSAETRRTAYTDNYTGRKIYCVKSMASGLAEANKMISSQGHRNGIILFFSDGLRHVGDFFYGAEKFVSNVPVHTFTLGGDRYNHGLETIAANSPGGAFHRQPVPEKPESSKEFSKLLDKLLLSRGTKNKH